MVYQTKVESGTLFRNGYPYDSSSDNSIFHGGQGVGIFVIGPDGELYCGGHVRDVFHHSSFFGSGAIMCGGEIRTNTNGQIVFLSNQSGHYRPTEEQNIQMLEWFERRGVNLAGVTFSYFSTVDYRSREMNAATYLKDARRRAEDFERQWRAFTELPGAQRVSFQQYKAWLADVHPDRQVDRSLIHLWKITRAAEKSPSTAILTNQEANDFPLYFQKIYFCKKMAKSAGLRVDEWLSAHIQTFEADFLKWKAEKEAEVRDRFEQSHMPISYDVWLEQQDDSEWRSPRLRVSLSDEERLAYKTTIEGGRLIRSGYPYNSSLDRGIARTERGVGIFVVGPDQELYCGGHVPNVFNQSSLSGSKESFFSGEIGTDTDGRITYLSNKGTLSNLDEKKTLMMLQYFADRGVDLRGVRFVRYGNEGEEPILYTL